MTSTIATLWETFGLTGLASAVAAVAALGWLAAGLGRRGRFRAWLRAAAAAAIAVVLATITSESIRSIEIDRSAEVLAAEAAAAQTAQAKFRDRAAGIRFAEDTVVDQADIAGVTAAEEEGAYERAVADQLANLPAYARGGRKERAGRSRDESPTEAAAQSAAGADLDATDSQPAAADDAQPEPRLLPEAQLVVADRFDRANRGLAWSLLSLTVGLVAWEYVRRFNTTFDPVWPLPLAGTWIDGMAVKEYVVTDVAANMPALAGGLAAMLEATVRKGESFILFAASDPLPGRDALPRLAIGPLHWDLPKRSFDVSTAQADSGVAEIVFESAWFGRGAFVLVGDSPAADAVVSGIVAALERRHECRAAPRHTVNLLWALDQPLPVAAAEKLRLLCPQMNTRLIAHAAG